MATTKRGSGLSAPSRDTNYSEHETLLNTTAVAQPGDNSIFPAVNPPPKTGHARTASGTTKISGTLNQPLNIVVLGASFAGLSVAHAFLDTTLAQLRTTSAAPNYRLILISPSTHIYWNIGAPRALVALGLIKQDDLFIPIEPGFQRHKGRPYTIIQGRAISWDNNARTVEVELLSSAAEKRYSQLSTTSGAQKRRSDNPLSPISDAPRTQTVPYHALIVATGSSAHSNLLSLHGPHTDTIAALTSIHAKLAAAKSIAVCGGGTSGIETAGQLATYLNYSRHWPVRRLVASPKEIILLTGSDRCLPSFPPRQSKKAECKLQSLGVDIRHNVRVSSAKEDFDLTGQVKVELDDETTLIVDAYIPRTGVSPNAAFAPPNLRDADGYITTNAATCRVDEAGARVYALGDVASFSQNYTLDAYAAVPVVQANLLNDLIAHELRLASPYGGNQDAIDALTDELYVRREKDSQLCPVTRFGGVGVLTGLALPSFMVHKMKGSDYRVRKAARVVVDGGNPYAKPFSKYE
jgi:NADH dehydrogenase FAD-containing subunit